MRATWTASADRAWATRCERHHPAIRENHHAIQHPGSPDHARYGIGHDDPGSTAPEQCRYDACAEVAADFIATGGALKATLPGGQYAVRHFRGTVEQVGEAWAALLRDWLPSSGFQLDARPCFEYYPKGAACDAATGEFECEICVPVVPR